MVLRQIKRMLLCGESDYSSASSPKKKCSVRGLHVLVHNFDEVMQFKDSYQAPLVTSSITTET